MSAWTVIAHTELGSAATNITFSSIPASYTDLYLVLSSRSDRSGSNNDAQFMQLNSDSGNHSYRFLGGNGSSANTASNSAVGFIYVGQLPGSTATSSTFGNVGIYIPNYTSSNAKSISVDSVGENNATEAYQRIVAGLWNSSSAISTIKIYPEVGPNLVQYSSATLWGITKGSSGGVTVS